MVAPSPDLLGALDVDKRLQRLERSLRPGPRGARLGDRTQQDDDVQGDLFDAKLEASEARTDTKFAELKGILNSKPSRWDLWGAFLALFVAILGILAFGGDRLALGLSMADQRQEQLDRDKQQDATANEMNAKLDRLLAK